MVSPTPKIPESSRVRHALVSQFSRMRGRAVAAESFIYYCLSGADYQWLPIRCLVGRSRVIGRLLTGVARRADDG